MDISIRLAGFEIRDTLCWLYGTGFPKSQNVSKAMDKAAGVERGEGVPYRTPEGGAELTTTNDWGAHGRRQPMVTDPATPEAEQWEGWGTALKPAFEPIILARKPLRVDGKKATVVVNVLEHGTGAINVDGCRVAVADQARYQSNSSGDRGHAEDRRDEVEIEDFHMAGGHANTKGRWPANVILDPAAAAMLDEQTGTLTSGHAEVGTGSGPPADQTTYSGPAGGTVASSYGDSGGASRFFYCAKAKKDERSEGLPRGMKNTHPTVKPVDLMRWLVRLVTPPGGVVLDPYCGSGTTLVAAAWEGRGYIGSDRDDEGEYLPVAHHRRLFVEKARKDSF
jgi:site-specific DNA-methyltransferase (adenine-specific)